MDAPGITVRPLIDMTGAHAFNEVFLDDVRLPADSLVGERGQGWALAKVTLGNERVSLSGAGALWGMGPTADDLIDAVRAAGGSADPLLRQRLARLWVEGEILRLLRLRTVSAAVAGPGAGSRGVGAQGARRRARPARDGTGPRPGRCGRHARGTGPAADPMASPDDGSWPDASYGPTASCSPRPSPSAAVRRRCSATSSPSGPSGCPTIPRRPDRGRWPARIGDERAGVLVALAHALAGPAGQLLGLVEHPVGVAGVLAGPVDAHRGQLAGSSSSFSWTKTSRMWVEVISWACMMPWDASWAQTWSMAALPGIPRATTMRQPSFSMRRLATRRPGL